MYFIHPRHIRCCFFFSPYTSPELNKSIHFRDLSFYAVLPTNFLKKFFWTLSKLTLFMMLSPLSIIFCSFILLYLLNFDVVGSAPFIAVHSCLSNFFSFTIAFLFYHLLCISLLALAIFCLSSFTSAFSFFFHICFHLLVSSWSDLFVLFALFPILTQLPFPLHKLYL